MTHDTRWPPAGPELLERIEQLEQRVAELERDKRPIGAYAQAMDRKLQTLAEQAQRYGFLQSCCPQPVIARELFGPNEGKRRCAACGWREA